MPKHPTPTFTPDQQQQLDRILKCESGYVANRARLLLALSDPQGLNRETICKAHGFSVTTGRRLIKEFWEEGLSSLLYDFNVGSGLKRRKLSPEATARAVEIALLEPANSKTIMSALIAEGLHSKAVHLIPHTLVQALKREGLTWQRTRYALKKNAIPSHTGRRSPT